MTASEAPLAGVRVDRRVMRVAALFVQPDGCYTGLEGVDAWPEQRDARRYAGPLPVVAHPPCQLWGAMAAVNYARWGGDHNKPGNDGGCFAAALAAVNRWGGVLEHPAKTRAWAAHGLGKPTGTGWQRSGLGWVCEVWQSAYGHRANKHGVGEAGQVGSWWEVQPEPCSVVYGMAGVVDQLRPFGNGQVPAVAATAWRILTHNA